MTVNHELLISLVLCRCQVSLAGSKRWMIRIDLGLGPDLTIAVRMAEGEASALDYYILPTVEMTTPRLRLAESNPSSLEMYRFETLDVLAELSRRSVYRRVA
ncbi:hypothetical protein D9M70_649400 [compost metagenome]